MARPEITTQKYKHIEYTEIDGQLYRVYRPFTNVEYFIMPIISLENEMLLDRERMERLIAFGPPVWPNPFEDMTPDDARDLYEDTSFQNMERLHEEE